MFALIARVCVLMRCLRSYAKAGRFLSFRSNIALQLYNVISPLISSKITINPRNFRERNNLLIYALAMAYSLTQVRDWNASLKTARPELVALFVGGTSGIGRSTAVKLASAIDRPTIYIVGRNKAAGAQVLEELKAANMNGSYAFMAADVSHLRNVDEVCRKLKSSIDALDLLFLSSGGLAFSKKGKTKPPLPRMTTSPRESTGPNL